MALSINDIKKMSPQAKALVIIVVLFLIGYLYWFYFLSDALTKKARLTDDLQGVEQQIGIKQKVVSQLDQYKASVEALEDNYRLALLKLPDQREIPGLFHSVASSGRDAGVEFALFEPKAAVPQTLEKVIAADPSLAARFKPSDQRVAAPAKPAAQQAKGKQQAAPEPEPFYEEIPVSVTVTGQYQSILHFFEKVARLPRIVNVTDITIGDRRDVKDRGYVLTASCTVRTYMFVDKQESISEQKK